MTSEDSQINFDDTRIMITGANRGLGAAICKELLKYSPKIIYGGYRRAQGEFKHPLLKWIRVDVTDQQSINRFAGRVSCLDLIINNAGILIPTSSNSSEERANLRAMMDVHLHGPLMIAQTLRPALQKKSRNPTLVNIISMSAFANVPGVESYCTTKAALHAATQGLRMAWPEINVVGVYPGPTKTDMTAGSSIPLADPRETAINIIKGLKKGQNYIFPDRAAQEVESIIGTGFRKLEKQFSELIIGEM